METRSPRFRFALVASSRACSARSGVFTTPHGAVATPAFMPVGTRGTVKGVYPPAALRSGILAPAAVERDVPPPPPLYFYRTAFGSVTSGIQDFGQGSALAVLMFLFVGAVTSIALKFLRAREIQT